MGAYEPTRYPLAPAAWGTGEELPVEQLMQAALFSDFGSTKGTTFIDVTLEPNPLSGGWRVRHNGAALGHIPAWQRQRYSDMERINGSILVPATVASVHFHKETGQFDLRVILPPPQLAVPRNNAPDGAIVLPPGDMVVIDTSRGEFWADKLQALSPSQWLVGFQVMDNADIVVTLDQRVLGVIGEDEAASVAAILDAAPATQVFARAYLLNGMAGLDIAPAKEAEDPALLNVPALKVADSRPRRPWSCVDFPDGSWAVTVERSHATDPADTIYPSPGARLVSLGGSAAQADRPVQPAPPAQLAAPAPAAEPSDPVPSNETTFDADLTVGFSPTTTWAVAGSYLTEVEKVRMRRAQRQHQPDGEEGGLHRK